jgi:hypothetical protein
MIGITATSDTIVFQVRGDSPVDPKKLHGKFPWITKDGSLDLTRFPIDSVLKQALSDDDQEFRTGLNLLMSMSGYGRTEAGVYLLGLLVRCDDNWEKRIKIVEAMKAIKTKPCADLLFGELKRVKSSNTTRRYLTTVIQVLSLMPSELIKEGFESLAADTSFTQRMRDKFKAALQDKDHGYRGFW